MSNLQIAVAIYIAYLIGSISSAIIVCKIMGLPDPRREGSLNPGATNVLRIGGKKAALFTLLGDSLKGLIPVLIARYLGFSDIALALIAFGAFLGHLYPLFFQFEGGKGVATALGALLGLSWPVGLFCIATWILIAFLSRFSSVASMLTFILAPFYIWFWTKNVIYVDIVALMTLFLIFRHRSNITLLIEGKENKLGRK